MFEFIIVHLIQLNFLFDTLLPRHLKMLITTQFWRVSPAFRNPTIYAAKQNICRVQHDFWNEIFTAVVSQQNVLLY